MNIFVFRNEISIKRRNNQVVLYEKEKKLTSYPISMIDALFLFGKIEISSSAISFLTGNNKPVVFLSDTGFFKGILLGKNLQSNMSNRIKQYEIYFSQEKSLNFARLLILKKISEIEKYFNISLEKEKKTLTKADNLNSILGVEGSASSKMFEKFRKLMLEIGISFSKRSYNPPKDEINSILSSAYTIFYNVLIPYLIKEGFDPFLGIFHKKKGIHHAFVSDLMEIIRPEITYSVYQYLKDNPVIQISFNKNGKGVYLEKDELKKLTEWFINRDGYIDKISQFISEL